MLKNLKKFKEYKKIRWKNKMEEARYYITQDDNRVKCLLCPRACSIENQDFGFCKARKNIKGVLYSFVYSHPVSIAFDPNEKKPLFHFYPGGITLSFGTNGCNLNCLNCQNYEISQGLFKEKNLKEISPKELVEIALKNKVKSIAYTYNEPTVFYEYMFDTTLIAKEKRKNNIVVTNGFINPKPLKDLIPYVDAFNVDVKGFSEKAYKKLAQGSLAPVLNSIKTIKESKKWIELTWLVVPGYSDNKEEFKDFVSWIYELDENTPLHISRFFPSYKLNDRNPTDIETMNSFYKIAKEKLKFVYLGNMLEHQDTFCPSCGSLLIKREFYRITDYTNKGFCKNCKYKISGIF